ncbi:helicase C-terminal domain-containing protein [Halalkalicoccus sp. GCM10025322]|uniref:ATP-dependent DNA helicase n=1 Tax=Halalkalicoccus TaxID=332246 RepID=UPI002F96BC36
MNPARIEREFPAPSYRGNQRAALRDVRRAFEAGNDVVLVRAPTGSGKSLLARAICGCARTVEEAEPEQATGAYYTTPQVSQLEDVAADPLLSDLQVIRGKGNYTCLLPGEETTPVNRAPCVRERGYDCSIKHRCPYFSDRAIAANRQIAAMTLAYFMQTAGSELFRTRDVCVIDEAHGLAEWAEMYATIDLGPRTVPIWDDLSVPEIDLSEPRSDGSSGSRSDSDGALDRLARFADSLSSVCARRKDELLAKRELTPDEAAERDRLQELVSELDWFVKDYRDPESPTTWVLDQDADRSLSIKPLNPERYLQHTVWDRANRFALLSATILSKETFCRGVGLDPDRVALVDVDHTFPVENRPLYDVTQGKMTYDERDETIPKVARVLVRIMAEHGDDKGIVHAHSYAIQRRLADFLADFGVGDRVRVHDREDRDAALEAWKESDRAGVFLAVKMEEALDLKGDLARWQVVCKAPYLNTNDPRVAHRLERGQWAWYRREALGTVIQACGRVVRSSEDYGATYLADSSLLDLFERTRGEMPAWFAEQVERMGTPELPSFEAATGALAGTNEEPSSGGSSSRRADDTGRAIGTHETGESSPGADRSHPLSDVWGDG